MPGDKKIDAPSDVEFAKAIADSMPEQDKYFAARLGAALLLGKAIRDERKKRKN